MHFIVLLFGFVLAFSYLGYAESTFVNYVFLCHDSAKRASTMALAAPSVRQTKRKIVFSFGLCSLFRTFANRKGYVSDYYCGWNIARIPVVGVHLENGQEEGAYPTARQSNMLWRADLFSCCTCGIDDQRYSL